MVARTLAFLAPSGKMSISDADIAEVLSALPAKAATGPVRWRSGRRTGFCPLNPALDVEAAATALLELSGRLDFDATLAPAWVAQERPADASGLLIADMESTIIEQEMLDELADVIGIRDRVAAITERAMRDELDFEAAITERVGLLAGLDAGVLDDLIANRLSYMPGAQALVTGMKATGAYCALVSGGFTPFTAHVAKSLGFDEHRANTIEISGGKLTGKVVPPILGREAKLQALTELTRRLALAREQTIAVGDGANDLAMLNAAGLGVAFRAKPNVRAAMARAENGAVITHAGLDAILHLTGLVNQHACQSP